MAEAGNKGIKEGDDERKEPLLPQEPNDPSTVNTATISPRRALSFWAYLTVAVSLLTLFCASLLPSLHPSDHRFWFLSLSDALRHHYSTGKLIKVHPTPYRPPLQIFAADHGPRDSETVLLLHGLGCTSYSFRRVLHSLGSAGLRAVAVDLPGSGFSDKLAPEEDRRPGGLLGKFWDVYSEISEKGIFWGFDQLVETGQIPYQDRLTSGTGIVESSSYGPASMGWVVGQVVDSMALAPVHLVLHDSALGAGANWVSMNPGSVHSVTLIDSSAESAAFPSWVLGAPVFGEVLLGSQSLFAGLLRLCCSRSVDGPAAEAYRLLLKGRSQRSSVAATGKALNYSFDLGEWADSEAVKGLPIQVLWSNTWTDKWIDEGRRVAAAVPRVNFASHSGGRWPQEDAAEEIAGMISQFVLSLPRSIRQTSEEPLPEHIQKMFDEANADHDHHHGHGHEHAAGFVNMYGLGPGWGT